MNKIWNFMNASIKRRLFFYLIVISVIPLILMQVLNTVTTNSLTKEVLVSSSEAEVESVLSNLEQILVDVEGVCSSIGNDANFQKRMRMEYPTLAERYSAELEANMDLASIVNTHKNIYGLYLLGENQLCCKSNINSLSRADYRSDGWYQEILASRSSIWYSLHEESFVAKTAGNKFISYGFPYVNKATGQNDGVIILDIEEETITSVLKQDMAQNGFFLLVDENNEVFYQSSQSGSADKMQGYVIEQLNRKRSTEEEQMESAMTISTAEALIVYQKSSQTKWTLVGVIPQDYISSSLRKIIYVSILMLLMVALLAVLTASFLAKRFTDPVIAMKKAMKSVEAGNLSTELTTEGMDEIAQLGQSFNHMVVRIKRLLESVYEKQEQLRKSEFRALQAQINPHFLYNSLDSIVWLLRMKRSDDAITMLQNLTILFRISLSKGHEVIPIGQELRHLESYMIIQSMRYSRKFTYSIDIAKEYREYYTLKLVLQPLVENCIYHGMSAQKGIMNIAVSLTEQENQMVFSVADTGIGMNQEELERLRQGIQVDNQSEELYKPTEKAGGYGLKNVNERIKIYFGEEYGLWIDSKEGEGTTVTLKIPTIKQLTE